MIKIVKGLYLFFSRNQLSANEALISLADYVFPYNMTARLSRTSPALRTVSSSLGAGSLVAESIAEGRGLCGKLVSTC